MKKFIIALFICFFIFSCSSDNLVSDSDKPGYIPNENEIHMPIGKKTTPPWGWTDYCFRQCFNEDPDPMCDCSIKYYFKEK